jgi:hypothetical protein
MSLSRFQKAFPNEIRSNYMMSLGIIASVRFQQSRRSNEYVETADLSYPTIRELMRFSAS